MCKNNEKRQQFNHQVKKEYVYYCKSYVYDKYMICIDRCMQHRRVKTLSKNRAEEIKMEMNNRTTRGE